MNIKDWNEERFLSYASNIFIQINRAILFKELEKIDHFVNDSVYNLLKENLEVLSKKHLAQVFYDMSVVQVKILEVKELENSFKIELSLVSGYGKISSSERLYRAQKTHKMIFEKTKESVTPPAARKCPGCEANIDINNNGKCIYCGVIYNLEDMDWILTTYEEK